MVRERRMESNLAPDREAPTLRVNAPHWLQDYPLGSTPLLIGSHPACDIVIPEPGVANCHARVQAHGSSYILTNLDGPYGHGLRHHGKAVQELPLLPEDEVHLTPQVFLTYTNQPPEELCLSRSSRADQPVTLILDPASRDLGTRSSALAQISLPQFQEFTIGRDPQNHLVLPYPTVSRFHAKIECQSGVFILVDLDSSNGTYLNGKRITTPAMLRPGDKVRIGCDCLVLNPDRTLTHHGEAGNLRLDALELTQVLPSGVKILNGVSLSIMPREFVAILGASGSGKSTLLDALNGLRPASAGQVLVNGVDLYRNYSAYFTQMGYVPQRNIIHEELTLDQVMDFSAQLRMPPDTTPEERRQRVQSVLKELGLSHRGQVQVKHLSGGQQRRACIAVELLTKPSLFFLDEATSGLDPGTEADMMSLLRELADQGRTIIMVTHITQNLRECDLVAYMAPEGRLAYFGPPEHMLDYFRHTFTQELQGIKLLDFSGVYRALDREKNPPAPDSKTLEQRYRQSPLYQEYIVERQQSVVENRPYQSLRPKACPRPSQRRVPAWQQLRILTARNLAVLFQDRTSLLITLTMAPLLAMLDFITWDRHLFDPTRGDANEAITMLFVSTLVAMMIGAMTTMRELVKEEEIYRRERMIGLKLWPYILSKVGVGALIALYQAGPYLLVKELAVNWPGGGWLTLGFYITFALAIFGGMILGLLVSAVAPNQNSAPLLIILFLVPQIIFSGGIQPVDSLGWPGQLANSLTVIKWPFESLVTLSGMGRDVARDPCWRDLSQAQRDNLTPPQLQQCRCYGPNIFKTCNFPGIKAKYVVQVDQPEPRRPEAPPKPQDPSQFGAYLQRLDSYQKALNQWQSAYSAWQKPRSQAIDGAQGLIQRFYKDEGYMFHVNVPAYWLKLGLVNVAMVGGVFLLQRRRDVV